MWSQDQTKSPLPLVARALTTSRLPLCSSLSNMETAILEPGEGGLLIGISFPHTTSLPRPEPPLSRHPPPRRWSWAPSTL